MFLEALHSPTFWAVVAAVYLAMRVQSGPHRTTWFAMINIAAITCLFGYRTAILAISVAIVVYLGIALALVGRSMGSRLVGFPWLLLVAAFIVFLPYKIQVDYGAAIDLPAPFAGSTSALSKSLAVLAGSYLFLRVWIAARSVLADGATLLNPLALSGYLTPFFMLGPGPINVYSEHLQMDAVDTISEETFSRVLRCTELITTGLLFKFVLANALLIFAAGIDGRFVFSNWFDHVWFLFYVFFDFAGYSLIALGIGQLIGVPTPINFDKPYLSRTVTEFWQRWHMSLGNFVRTQIFIPLQLLLVRRFGIETADWTALISMCCAFGFVGLWHRLTLSFLLWGIALALVMSAEKRVIKIIGNTSRRSPHRAHLAMVGAILGPLYVACVIATSFLLVANQMAPAR